MAWKSTDNSTGDTNYLEKDCIICVLNNQKEKKRQQDHI